MHILAKIAIFKQLINYKHLKSNLNVLNRINEVQVLYYLCKCN